MTPDLFWIPGRWRGKLAVATRPRGGDWLEDEARGWREAGLDIVVSLLEPREAAELGLANEAAEAQAVGIRLISFPIPDLGVPEAMLPSHSLLRQLRDELMDGHTIAVHCRQGIGRAGLIAAGVLVASGTSVEHAIEAVSTARGLTVPETQVQLDWLHELHAEEIVVTS